MCGQGYLSQPGCVCVYSEELWWLCWCIFLRCEFHICNTVLVHISSLRESRLSSLVGAEGFRNIFSIHLELIELLSLGLIVGPFPQNCWLSWPGQARLEPLSNREHSPIIIPSNFRSVFLCGIYKTCHKTQPPENMVKP